MCSVPIRLLVLLLLASSVPAWAQPAEPFVLTRLAGPVHLDGRSDEPAWEAVAPLPLVMHQPTYEGPPTERTEIRVAYDDAYLYAAGRFYDTEPGAIRDGPLYRDQIDNTDLFWLLVDTFNDNETARAFWTTPAGIRGDLAVAGDGASQNASWNTYWDVATVRTAEGWFAELRIPFSSLGFQHRGGDVVMGLLATRRIWRKNEVVSFPALPSSWNPSTPSRARDVVLAGVFSQKPVYVTPYALGGLGRSARLDDARTAFRYVDDVSRDVGLDLKYNLTNNLTLDATVNTDFAQAEADDQQVNLTRFSLFFPEKRQFFQERGGIFEFNTRNERLFHSRRIGLHQGQAVPILGGGRLVGRLGDWDVGLLDLQTAARPGLPSENFGVARLRRQVFNENSTAGGIVASRLGADGRYNVAYGLDGVVRLAGYEYLSVNWAQTFDDAQPGAQLRNGLFEVGWERRRLQGWSYTTTLTRMGRGYNPEMGFVTRTDYTQAAWLLHYNGFPGTQSRFQRTMPVHFQGALSWRNADGSLESASVDYLSYFWGKGGNSVGLTGSFLYEDLPSPLGLPEASAVPAGRYAFYQGNLYYATSNRRRWRATATLTAGSFYDGWIAGVSVSPQWTLSRFFDLSGAYSLDRVRFPDGRPGFDAHLLQVRAQAALNRHLSTNAFVQYNSAADVVTANVRFRYNFREGNDLWIVVNEVLNADRRRIDPMLPFASDQTLLLKYTHTFTL